MPYSHQKLRWRGEFFRAHGRWPSTAEMHSAFDGSVPEESPTVPWNVPVHSPEDSPEEQLETLPSASDPGSGERPPTSPRARWNVWTGFL